MVNQFPGGDFSMIWPMSWTPCWFGPALLTWPLVCSWWMDPRAKNAVVGRVATKKAYSLCHVYKIRILKLMCRPSLMRVWLKTIKPMVGWFTVLLLTIIVFTINLSQIATCAIDISDQPRPNGFQEFDALAADACTEILSSHTDGEKLLGSTARPSGMCHAATERLIATFTSTKKGPCMSKRDEKGGMAWHDKIGYLISHISIDKSTYIYTSAHDMPFDFCGFGLKWTQHSYAEWQAPLIWSVEFPAKIRVFLKWKRLSWTDKLWIRPSILPRFTCLSVLAARMFNSRRTFRFPRWRHVSVSCLRSAGPWFCWAFSCQWALWFWAPGQTGSYITSRLLAHPRGRQHVELKCCPIMSNPLHPLTVCPMIWT